MAPDTLAKRLERLKAGGTLRRMNADALGRTMIDGDKDRDLTLAGDGGGQIGAPHGVDRLGDDGPVMAARPARRAAARGGEQVVLAHQPQHPAPGGAGATMAQPGPDLAMPLAMEGAGGQHRPDRLQEVGIWHRSPRPGPPGRG